MNRHTLTDFLCHYYEATDGPFRNLSDLPLAEAEGILQQIRQAGSSRFAGQGPTTRWLNCRIWLRGSDCRRTGIPWASMDRIVTSRRRSGPTSP
jgi:hypothetical protein